MTGTVELPRNPVRILPSNGIHPNMTKDSEGVEPKPTVLTPNTWVPLGVVSVLFVTALSAALWLNSRLQSIDFRLQLMQDKLDHGGNETWSDVDMKVWVRLLKADNPSLKVPDADRQSR